MQHPVYYTLEEARLLLPNVEEKVFRLRRVYKELEFLSTINVNNEEGKHDGDLMIAKLNKNYYKKLYFYHKYIVELLSMGIVIKDMQKGLVDFYAKHQGRDIHLCWHLGEKDIKYWHEIDEGFASRQSIDILEKKIA